MSSTIYSVWALKKPYIWKSPRNQKNGDTSSPSGASPRHRVTASLDNDTFSNYWYCWLPSPVNPPGWGLLRLLVYCCVCSPI
ncbi:MAG: hypothetical protein F6K31_33820 [Symploca sp. SIO2G7]|nr:hypothetical protein [Symploca sp. SIO2G7]